jgi:uncharacterized integral membrane protein
MRARTILLILAILAVAGFAMLNWAEFVRPVPLSFGAFITDAPLGLVMLGLLVFFLLAFVLMSAFMRTQSLVETHHHHKALDQQRELADKAEASRFTELRQHIDVRLREIENRLDLHLRNLPRGEVLREPVRDPLIDPLRDPLRRDPLAQDAPVRMDPNRPEWVGRERV